MFTNYPTYWVYRALHVTDPQLDGEDVYALQLALNAVGQFNVPLVADGVLGVKTGKAIEGVQRKLKLEEDGVAGQVTQKALALAIAKEVKKTISLPEALPKTQLAHESSFLLGNYSKQYPDKSFDAGAAQRNTNFTNPKAGFDPVDSIQALCQRVRDSYDRYAGMTNELRRWKLAVGSWNAPAFANYIAREEGATNSGPRATPDAEDRAKLEAYIDSCCATLKL
jgi:hypothetical protein